LRVQRHLSRGAWGEFEIVQALYFPFKRGLVGMGMTDPSSAPVAVRIGTLAGGLIPRSILGDGVEGVEEADHVDLAQSVGANILGWTREFDDGN
jgi:hypothetical protein